MVGRAAACPAAAVAAASAGRAVVVAAVGYRGAAEFPCADVNGSLSNYKGNLASGHGPAVSATLVFQRAPSGKRFRSQSTIPCRGVPGVNSSATPFCLRVAMSSSGMMPPPKTTMSVAWRRLSS